MNHLETTSTKKCSHCGFLNINSAKHCKVCQTSLGSKQSEPSKIAQNFTLLKLANLLRNSHLLTKKTLVRQKAIEAIKPWNLVGISLILIGAYLWYGRLRQERVVTTQNESDIQIVLAQKIAEVDRVPQGIFNYTGEGYFAALFSGGLQEEIIRSFPNFDLGYVAPDNRDPSYSVAIEMLIDGEIDFVFNGRALNPAESNKASLQGLELYSHPIARDGIVFFYGEDVGVDRLSIEQLQAIFSGRITNWQQLGANKSLPIVPIVLAEENLADLGFEVDNSQNSIRYVANHTLAAREVIRTPGAFSYASASLLTDQSLLNFFALGKVKSDNWQQIEYVAPFQENGQINIDAMKNNTYPLTRRLYIVYSDRPTSQSAGVAMVNFISSLQGQSFLERSSFIPLRGD
jgi:phosphate transport system substrate-binding protein